MHFLLFNHFPSIPASYMALSIICILVGSWIFIFYKRAKKIDLQKKRLEREIDDHKRIVNEQAKRLSGEKISRVEMFSNIMEAIQTPMSSIVGLNYAIMDNRYGSANKNIMGASRIALSNGEKILELVNDMAELASLEKANLRLKERYIDFFALIHDLYESTSSTIRKKGVYISFNNQIEKGKKIWLDVERFEKIFSRLVLIAVECTPRGGQIIISIELSKEENIILSVEDSGIGMDKNEIQALLDCYFRSDCKKAFHTYGLLPALIRSYADLFNGEFFVDSDIGKGTTFIFSFPIKKVDSSSMGTIPAQATSTADDIEVIKPFYAGDTAQTNLSNHVKSHKKLRGLIISNDEYSLEYIKRSLEDDCHTLFARNRQEVMSLLKNYESKIDFIICNGTLPFKDELQLIYEVKSDDKWRRIPLIVVANEVKVSLKIKSWNLGINDYLIAPFCAEQLVEKIERATQLASKKDEWHVNTEPSSTVSMQVSEADLTWLIELENMIQKEISNRQFNLSEVAYQMAISERQLFRKVKELTGQTPNKYLREMRLYAAKKLLEGYVYDTVAEVSYAVGFQDAHYFSKVYHKRFNKWPSDYLLKTRTA